MFFWNKMKKVPANLDYSSSDKKFDFYGYSALINGWNIDGVDYHSGEDYLSVERIKEYKYSGMTIYFPQTKKRQRIGKTAVQNVRLITLWKQALIK